MILRGVVGRSSLLVAAAGLCACGGSERPPPPPLSAPPPAVVVADAAPAAPAPPAAPGRSPGPPVIGTEARPAVIGTEARPAASPAVTIVDWPIAWSDERERLMLAYRRQHSDPAATDLTIAPTMIVLHYTGGGSAKATKRYFDRTLLESGRARLRDAGAVNVSAHFLVDRDGTIYRLQPETRMARHCIGLNHIAIGIENVGDDDKHPLTDAQVAADAALVRHLAARFPITHLIGHSESRGLEGTPLFVERDPRYRNSKPDPGARFMAAVRAKLADLGL